MAIGRAAERLDERRVVVAGLPPPELVGGPARELGDARRCVRERERVHDWRREREPGELGARRPERLVERRRRCVDHGARAETS